MEDKNRHVAANISFDVGDKTYVMSPLKIRDIKELEEYLASLPLKRLAGVLDGLPERQQDRLIDRAEAESKAIKIGTAEFDAACSTFDGYCHMFWLMLRKNHEIGRQAAVDLFNDQQVINDLHNKIKRAAGFYENPTKGPVTE